MSSTDCSRSSERESTVRHYTNAAERTLRARLAEGAALVVLGVLSGGTRARGENAPELIARTFNFE